MARNKELLIKDIKNDLESALHVLKSAPIVDALEYHEIKSAASAATQAAMNLHRLAGMLDVEASLT